MSIIKSWSIALLCSVCALVLAGGTATAGGVSSISLDTCGRPTFGKLLLATLCSGVSPPDGDLLFSVETV